jgi:DNA (cytosine-5)-methyltransferase 1
MRELALFAGAGGGILGGRLLGWRTVCAVEFDAYARDVLVARQNDGCLEAFPVWDDVRTFDGRPWRGLVDVVSGGFPCQDISCAGKGAGIDGERSGLWREFARIIGEVRPRFVFVENSPMLTVRGLGTVLGDLAAMGFDARWGVLGACDAGAPHKRERIWIVADAAGAQDDGIRGDCECGRNAVGRREQAAQRVHGAPDHDGAGGCGADVADADCSCGEQPAQEADAGAGGREGGDAACGGGGDVADADGAGCEEQRCALADGAEHEASECGDWWESEPDVGRVADGVAARVDRLRCIGNGQVPAVAALAWRVLNGWPAGMPGRDWLSGKR